MNNVSEDTKNKLRAGNTPKQFSIKVYKADESAVDFTISNDNLVYEQVEIEEKMCSGSDFKFGLCEASSLSFQYFGLGDISGRKLEAFYYVDDEKIPMGFYYVTSCIRESLTGKYKVTAFNMLKSSYLDKDISLTSLNVDSEGVLQEEVTLKQLSYEALKGFMVGGNSYDVSMIVTSQSLIPLYGEIAFSCINPDTQEQVLVEACRLFIAYSFSPSDYQRFKINFEKLRELIDASIEPIKDYEILTPDGTETITFKEYYDNYINKNVDFAFGTTIQKSFDSNDIDVYDSGFVLNPNYAQSSNTITFYGLVGFSSPPGTWGIDQIVSAFNAAEVVRTYSLQETDAERIVAPVGTKLQGTTIRELEAAILELDCMFGRLDRQTNLFYGISLESGFNLGPFDTLYPKDTLYPYYENESAFKSQYKKLYSNNKIENSFRNLIINYIELDVDGNETESTYQRTINAGGNVDYIVDNNWILKNISFYQSQIVSIANSMASAMRDKKWINFECENVGLPYLETGDKIELKIGDMYFNSYIFERTIKGINNLEETLVNGTVDIF